MPILVAVAAVDIAALLFILLVHLPVWLTVLVALVCLSLTLAVVCDLAVKDIGMDDDGFKVRLAELLKDRPDMLEHMGDPVVEPEDYRGRTTRIEELLQHSDRKSHRHLSMSRLRELKVIRTCSRESLYDLSFADIADMYGVPEDEIIQFLGARCPGVIYKRTYYRTLKSMQSE